MRIGADTGGTFTDLVTSDGRVHKVPSTPASPSAAVRSGVDTVVPSDLRPELLAHGTTVATNALLERDGARVALVTTRGFADVIEIARQDRPSLYDPFADRPEPLVPRSRRFEVEGRLAADGAELEAVGDVDALQLGGAVDAVAVCLLHADLDSRHERQVADRLRARGFDVTCSHEVSPEFREYERTVTTVGNAFLRPRVRTYLRELDDVAEDVLVMTSASGLLPVAEAAELPVALLLSGPAGGVRAGAAAGLAAGFGDVVTFDMGGTSTDVCLVRDGVPDPSPQLDIGGLPFRFPALDIHTVGAGGGSVAFVDAGGALRVGPRSAGAEPGPVCYRRGGGEPTVTDADLVLGRIPPEATFPGLGTLDVDAARDAFASRGVDPAGVVAVVDANMEEAVRVVTVERGVDPRELALVAFGGAGPLHACAIAEALEMRAVVVPPRAGVLSAVGLLSAPRQREVVRSWPTRRVPGGLGEAVAEISSAARGSIPDEEPAVEIVFDCRYSGQSHEIQTPSVDAFHAEHERRNGWSEPDAEVEVTALRARARGRAPLELSQLPVIERRAAVGPAVLTEPDCTVYVPEGWRADVHRSGAWLLARS